MAPSSSSSSTTLSTLNPDIIRTHILTRLDGPSLAALSCTSMQFLALSADEDLWQEICSALWSSTTDSRVRQVISTFPGGHRSFFSDSSPLLDHKSLPSVYDSAHSPGPSALISAVDLYYKNKPVFSKVRETKTTTTKFLCSRFKIELLDQNETVLAPVQKFSEIDSLLIKDLKENLSLSWILIDPVAKRAANLSSGRPVMVEYPCTRGEVELCYSTIMTIKGRPGLEESENVECRMMVTCGGMEGGELRVDDVSMEIKDVNGRSCDGRESLVMLLNALVRGSRKRAKTGEQEDRFSKFEKVKSEGKVQKPSGDGVISVVCNAVVGLVTFGFALFWFGILYMAPKTHSKFKNNYTCIAGHNY